MSDLAITIAAFSIASFFGLLIIWIISTAIADACELLIREACKWYYTRKDSND